MNPAETKLSIIIPTHNRAASARRLLEKLAHQTCPNEMMEVVVVANSCVDDTVAMLQQYDAPYKLTYAETNGTGPATPRNKGASLAAGQILIFLDDDVDPSENLAEAHVRAHEDDNTVVIGYLPLAISGKPGYYRRNLAMWWENKFQQMRKSGYRFGYEDLLSGNFSISSSLFRKVNGFITSLRCRDDYELGIRLLNANAHFKFCKNAVGLHRDEVTDLNRSLQRKREEGRMDVKLWQIHPAITTNLQNDYRQNKFAFLQSRKLYFMIHFPRAMERLARFYKWLLNIAERFRMHGTWHRMSYRLHTYWYYRGLVDQLQTKQQMLSYFSHEPAGKIKRLDIDLQQGFTEAENILDRERPHSITVWFGPEKIEDIPYKPGMERLKGVHLRRLMATEATESLSNALALRILSRKVVTRKKNPHP